MTRLTSLDFASSAYAQETGVFPILLLTISHPNLTTPIRISTDNTQRVRETVTNVIYGTISNTITYIFYPMSITLPGESDEGPADMTVEIDNVSRDLIPIIRNLATPPTVNVDIVLNTAVNVILGSWPEYLLVNITINALTISGSLMLETLVSEPFPAGSFNPSEFPGMF